MPQRVNKKFMLTLSEANAIWTKYKKTNLAKDQNFHFKMESAVEDLFGKSQYRNLYNWSREDRDPTPMLNVYSKTIKDYLNINMAVNLFCNEISSKKFGEVVGLSPFQCNYIFDCAHSSHGNALESIIYDKETALDLAVKFCGVYKILMIDEKCGELIICTLDVRYPIPCEVRNKRPQYKLRCKLNVPNGVSTLIHPDKINFEYDGFISYKPNCINIIMESRKYATERTNIQIFIEENSKYTNNGVEYVSGQLFSPGGGGIRGPHLYPILVNKVAARDFKWETEFKLTRGSIEAEEAIREALVREPRRLKHSNVADVNDGVLSYFERSPAPTVFTNKIN